uniref:Uncharacterized protein n=1 Tax=Acrobeloides nanus TaxID=290746 RepID=A0A914CD52_9BILA
MPRTVYYLREKYGAVPFQYLNKVGMNSRPNGMAILLGKSYFDYGYGKHCQAPFDNEWFIGFEYQERGYKTLMSEDWALGVFNYPNCVGFKNITPTDHYMR